MAYFVAKFDNGNLYYSLKLAHYRIRAGLTQSELASKVGLSKNSISAYETGNASPTLNHLIEIAFVLKCSIDDLITFNPFYF